jgi:DNA modification methylase
MNILCGDAATMLARMPERSVQMVMTSPPYFGLRDYGVEGQLGLEPTPDAFVAALVDVFQHIRRVLKDDGVCWLNLGDSYAGGGGFCATAPSTATSKSGKYGTAGAAMKSVGSVAGLKAKDLIGTPWRVAFALQADGWYLRSDVIWHKPNPMPESVTDRPTRAHEYLFLLTKQARYYYDADAIREPFVESTLKEIAAGYDGTATKDYGTAGAQDPSAVKSRIIANIQKKRAPRPGVDVHGGNQGQGGIPISGVGRNKRSVWTITPQPFKGAHFATFPEKLVEPCVLAGSRPGDTVLDPFCGSGRAGIVALKHGRSFIGIDLNIDYCVMAIEALSAIEAAL